MAPRAGGQRTSRRAEAADHGPIRSCVGCGRRTGKTELVRIALAAEQQPGAGAPRLAVLDRDGRLAGRGAYLCRQEGLAKARPECLEKALERRAFARTLRAKVTLDPKLVELVSR